MIGRRNAECKRIGNDLDCRYRICDKDNWLLSGIVWGALFLRHWEGIDFYFSASLPVLVWLLGRTSQRLRVLSH